MGGHNPCAVEDMKLVLVDCSNNFGEDIEECRYVNDKAAEDNCCKVRLSSED